MSSPEGFYFSPHLKSSFINKIANSLFVHGKTGIKKTINERLLLDVYCFRMKNVSERQVV
jgi:hypothetical protein